MATWNLTETVHLIALYQRMADLQSQKLLGPAASRGQTSKAALVRQFIADHAPQRNKQSVEMKLMNISAARLAAGLPLVDGYKPLANGATILTDLVQEGEA